MFCGWEQKIYDLDPRHTIAIERSSKNVTYHDAPKRAAIAYFNESEEAEIIIRFVTGLTVSDGPTIVRIPVRIRIAPDMQFPQTKRKDQKLTGTMQERLTRITQLWLRDAQQHYLPQILNHVLWGLVSWDGVNESSLKRPKQYEQLLRSLAA